MILDRDPSLVSVVQDECPTTIGTPEVTDGLTTDIQQETKRAVNKTYVRGRLTKWAEEHFGELGLIEFITESDLAEILKAAIKTTSGDCFREQKPVPRKTPLQARTFFRPVMTKVFDLCSAEALEQCRSLNLSTGLKLLVCAVEFARIAGLEITPALISCFGETRGKLPKDSELEKLYIQAQTLFPDLTASPPEDSLSKYDVGALISLSREAVAEKDWERVIVLQRKILEKGPRDPVGVHIVLARALTHTGRIAEAIEQRLEISKLQPESVENNRLLAQLYKLTELRETHTVEQLNALMKEARQAQNPTDALSYAQRLLAIAPDFIMAHVYSIHALHDLGRLDEELQACERLATMSNFKDETGRHAERIRRLRIKLAKLADPPAGIPDDYKDFDGDIVSLNMSDLIRFAIQTQNCKDYERAIVFRRRLIEVQPARGDNYVFLAIALASLNRYQEAGKVLEEMDHPSVHETDDKTLQWAKSLKAKIDEHLAKITVVPATAQQPEFEISTNGIASLIGQAQDAETMKDWETAIKLRRQLIHINPSHPANYLYLSFDLEHFGLYEKALEIYMAMIQLPTYSPEPGIERKHEARMAYLRRMIRRPPQPSQPPTTTPTATPAAPDYKAPRFYKDVGATGLPHLSVNDLILFSMQAQSVKNGYDNESAIVFLEERLRRDPNSRSALMNLQHSYKQLGRYREALEILEKLRNHRTIRGNPEKESMVDEKIADARRHIEAEDTRQHRQAGTLPEKSVRKIFWCDFLSDLCGKVESWPVAEGGGNGWHAVPADERDNLEKTLILCRRTLQHNRMLPAGKPGEKSLNDTIKDVRRGCINTHVLDRLMTTAGDMAGRVVIDLNGVL